MKTLKTVFVVLLFVFEGIMTLVMANIAYKEYTDGRLGVGLAAVVFFCGAAVVSMAELFRLMFDREKIILPMFGMKAICFSLGITVGMFADYANTADKSSLGAGITFAVLTVVLILAFFGIIQKSKQKQSAKAGTDVNALEQIMFTRFSAEWYWDDIVPEFIRVNNLNDIYDNSGNLPDEYTNRIYIYACNRIAYLYEWLLRRNGLSHTYTNELFFDMDEINGLKDEQGNPSEFIYNYMDGKLCQDDIEPMHLHFLHSYYERLGYMDKVRDVSYAKDYDEIVLDSRTGKNDILYCFDFSWDKYRLFEKRLDERYEAYLKESSGENMIKQNRHIFSETLNQELYVFIEEPVFAEPFADIKKQSYDRYIEDCLAHAAAFPTALIDTICEKLAAEWNVVFDGETKRDMFLSQIDAMDISIYKPYGEEIAYVLGFEADFEREHGVAVCIWNDQVLSIDYRMDACSPWSEDMERYKIK